jgi:chromosome partitioning protein
VKPPLIYSLAARKGGVGKTTLTLALAAKFSRAGRSVAVVDLDPQQSATLLLSSGLNLPRVELVEASPETLQRIAADVVLVDMAPGLPDVDKAVASVASAMLILVEAHILAVTAAARMLEDVRSLTKCALVLNKVDERRQRDREAPAELTEFGAPVFQVRSDGPLSAAIALGLPPPKSGRASNDLDAVIAWLKRFAK